MRRPLARPNKKQVDAGAALCDKRAHASHPHHRRRARRLRGRLADRRAAAFPSSSTKCGPTARTEAHRTARLAELVCSNSFRSDDAETNAVGVLHREMRALRLDHAQAPTPIRCRPAARSRSTATASRAAVEAAIVRQPLISIERGEIAGLPPEDWDNVDRRDRAADLPGARRGDRRPDRRRRARLLRRDRADRASRFDRHGRRLAAVALRQGGPGGDAAAYVNCPMSRDQYEAFVDALLAGGEDRVPRIRGHALFRRLPADRGDGRARPRDAAPRADEAGRPHQRARAESRSPTRSCSCGRTTRSARSSTSSASRPS